MSNGGKTARRPTSMRSLYGADRREGKKLTFWHLLGNIVLIVLFFVAVYHCYRNLFLFIYSLLEIIDGAIQSIGRRNYTIYLRRLDDDFKVLTHIDRSQEISYIAVSGVKKGTCQLRETVKDFAKGTEVFSYGFSCYIRFINQSSEGYEQQVNLLRALKDLPLVQASEPVVMQAVQHMQFTHGLYELIGRNVAQRCLNRRLFWIFPAGPILARHLKSCRCFDTFHARYEVCQETQNNPKSPKPKRKISASKPKIPKKQKRKQ